MRRRKRVPTAAADSSGFETTHASRYYVWRASRCGKPSKHFTYRRFPKLGVICDTANHAILSALPTRGPSPDVNELDRLLRRRARYPTLVRLAADAGYDSESNHRLLRENYGIRSIIPAEQGRPSSSGALPAGRYRRLMRQRFDPAAYHRRSQVETSISMLKRNLGSWVRGQSYWSQCRELLLMVITHNVMIAYLYMGFLQSRTQLVLWNGTL